MRYIAQDHHCSVLAGQGFQSGNECFSQFAILHSRKGNVSPPSNILCDIFFILTSRSLIERFGQPTWCSLLPQSSFIDHHPDKPGAEVSCLGKLCNGPESLSHCVQHRILCIGLFVEDRHCRNEDRSQVGLKKFGESLLVTLHGTLKQERFWRKDCRRLDVPGETDCALKYHLRPPFTLSTDDPAWPSQTEPERSLTTPWVGFRSDPVRLDRVRLRGSTPRCGPRG